MKCKFKAHCRSKEDGSEPIAEYLSIGDCTIVHIGMFRDALVEKYGEESCSAIQKKDDYLFIEYSDDLIMDWYEALEISECTPSTSNCSCSLK